MRVCRTLVTRAGDDLGVLLIRNVVDGERVLVVAVADIDSLVALIRAAVLQALGTVFLISGNLYSEDKGQLTHEHTHPRPDNPARTASSDR